MTTPAASLADFKQHLSKSDDTDDFELNVMLEAATELAEGLVGPIVNRSVTSRVHFPGGVLTLPSWPVVSVESVTDVRGDSSYVAADLEVDTAAGMVRLDGGGALSAGVWDVTYTAGRAAAAVDVPASIRLAVLIIGKHLWETQRGKSTRRSASGQMLAEEERAPQGFAVPHRAAQLLMPYRVPTVA